jgi:hypothetical protein
MHHSAVFDMDNYAEYLVYNAYTAHAGVHLMIGGAGGGTASCEDWSMLTELIGENKVNDMKAKSTFAMRNVWRSDLCTEPSSEKCDGSVKDGDTSECKLVCKGCELEQFTTDQKAALNMLWIHDFNKLTEEEQERVTRKVFCDSKVLMGEHIEGASAVDVSFWPIHPTMERLIQYKQLVHPFTDYTWDARPYETTWNSECKWGMQFDTDCLGHAMNDATVGKMQFLNEDSGEYETKHLTNQEILSATKPAHTSKLSYVYDNFDYTHCESEGIIFKKIPKNLQNN